ncbi:sperm acrosome developmental regulator-like isoform X2 [Dunckerocampus dactyliophorus]|uniref:sperm acrosome developmental regulator-like isoform X2 n=1 Tax=Dunckerocampus dactyliophorus TaxID=161453 RepID=UPI002406B676|nr:sperm acrosome developmental regulator-like isoform X2 [Dunckerocampus dactyliophorus]
MNCEKKRSGFQITSVTPDSGHTSNSSQPPPGMILTVIQSTATSSSPGGSSSQPTTPSLKRKYISHDALVQGCSSSRFRLVRLAGSSPSSRGHGDTYRRGRWMCKDLVEQPQGVGLMPVMDSIRHAHSLESLESISRETGRGLHLQRCEVKGEEGVGLLVHGGPVPIKVQLPEDNTSDSTPPLLQRARNLPPSLHLSTTVRGESVLRLSRSQPSSPPAGAVHLTPIQAPAAFGLDQSIFSLPADISSCSSSVLAIDNKIQQAMDLVKSHLMLAVREEVELLREQIKELQEKNQQLEAENHILRTHTHI